MASRRSLRKQPEGEPQGRRRSLRLASQKAVPLNHQRSVAYHAPTTSALMDFVTPRTVLKKVLQTQTVVSPLVSEKPDSPKPIDTIFQFPEKTDSSISLEVSPSDLSQRQKSKIARHPTRSKKVRLSVFERDLNNQFHCSTDQGLLDQTSLTQSLQISFTTPAPLMSAGKKGLLRRPKHYRRVNLKDFEGGLEQDLLQIKDAAENYPEDQKTTTLQSNNTEAQSVETELFLPPHSSEENDTEPSNVLPEPDLARPSFGGRRAPTLSQTRLARQDKISDAEVEKVPESSIPKEILTPGSKRTVEAETECAEEKDDRSKGRCQESPEEAGKGLSPSQGKEKLSPGTEDASSMESISQERIVMPQRQQQNFFHGNSPDEELSTPQEPLKTGLGARRSSTPTSDTELPEAFQSSFSSWLSRKTVRRSVNELVAHITQELDSLVPAVAGQSLAKVGLQKGLSLHEKTVGISQSPRVVTPKRRASGKTPKSLERTPFKEMRDRTNPQTGGRNKTKESRNVETEQVLEFETEGNPEVEEMSESEDIAVGISQSPRVVTPKSRASGKTPKSLERTPFKEMRDRTNPQTGGRNKTKESRNVETEQVLESEAEGNSEAVEMSEFEDIAVGISQSPRVVTPKRRASGKTPKSLERTPFKKMRDRTNPQTGGRNKTKESRNVETEQVLESEAEGNSEAVEMSESEDIAVGISQSPRVVTPKSRASGKTPKSLERTPFKEMRDRTNPQTGGRNKTKESRNVETEQVLESEAEGNSEAVEMSEFEDIAVGISQSPRVVTPKRRASGKTPKSLERTPFKKMRDRTNPQTGGRNKTKESRNVETEQVLESEAEGNSEAVEMSESEDIAVGISQSPRVVTPKSRASGKTPKSLERTPFKEMRDRTNPQTGGRNKTKESRNVETEQVLESEAEGNSEAVEMSEFEDIAVGISQSPRVVTPKRRASGKTPKSLERTPFKKMRDRTNPQTGGRNKTKESRNVETEQVLESEAEGNSEAVEMSESEDIAVGISQSPRVVTPKSRASGKTPKSLERTPFKEMRDRTNPQTGGRNKTKESRNVETEQVLESEAEGNSEAVEMSEFEDIAVGISQSPRVVTPKRRASGKTPKSLERTPFKKMRDRTNPQTGGRNKTKESRNVETEQVLESEAEGNSEAVEMSESEDIAVGISQSPRVVTPKSRASGKTPKSLERTPFKEMRDRTNPQTGGRNKTKESRNVETEQVLEFETEGNPEVEEMSESEDIAVGISQSPRVVTPKSRASGKTPKSLERTPFKEMRDQTNPQTGGRNKTKESRNVETEQVLESEAEGNSEAVEMSEFEDIAVGISQSPRVVTPKSRASGKTPKSLERTQFKEMRDRTIPQTGGRNETKETRNVEIEQVLESEAEGNPEVEEMSESENIEPTGNTPAFVRAKAFHCTPLLSSPRVLKEAASVSPVKQDLVQRVPKKAKKACRRKREPSLPNSLVKKMFIHHVKMPVTKEALEAVERCVNVYFKQLSEDLDAYVTHARRKIVEPADLELLMKRQGLITDKMPLNVLVERHLPFEYRKLLIPIATSGNKVIPQKPK